MSTGKKNDSLSRLFRTGCYVMLPVDLLLSDGRTVHPEAGRIGRINSESHGNLVVEYFDDRLIGKLSACILPKQYWLPVPEFLVEEYEPRAKKHGWRLSVRGVSGFEHMEWPKNAATEGNA